MVLAWEERFADSLVACVLPSTGTSNWFSTLVGEGPLGGLLFPCALSGVRRGFDGDAIWLDVALYVVGEGATVGDCDETEFWLPRDRWRRGEPWRGDLEEANWKARGDAFLASLVRMGDVVNMVVRVHGKARSSAPGKRGGATRQRGGQARII